jgi:hypothetical protein
MNRRLPYQKMEDKLRQKRLLLSFGVFRILKHNPMALDNLKQKRQEDIRENKRNRLFELQRTGSLKSKVSHQVLTIQERNCDGKKNLTLIRGSYIFRQNDG